jgi:hypothetical protein
MIPSSTSRLQEPAEGRAERVPGLGQRPCMRLPERMKIGDHNDH